jgi:hypothetical protein
MTPEIFELARVKERVLVYGLGLFLLSDQCLEILLFLDGCRWHFYIPVLQLTEYLRVHLSIFRAVGRH